MIITNLKSDIMVNAKEELLEFLENIISSVVCAYVEYGGKKYILKRGWLPYDLREFIQSLNFEYDNHVGVLYGVVWFDDGSWLSRHDDGVESWLYCKVPQIPQECLNHL